MKILRKLIDRGYDTRLLLIGDGELKCQIFEMIVNLKLENYVIWLGMRQDVYEFLSAMDVFVMPSLYEGLPISAIEAQVNGLPLIISDNVDRDVDISNNVIYISASSNEDIWVDSILIAERQNIISDRYNIKETVKKMLTIYQQI